MVEQELFQIPDGSSILTSPLQFIFRPITHITLNKVVTENHYAHRAVPVSYAFGAYFFNVLYGCLSIGKPCSNDLCEGICGAENSPRVYELNRLWFSDKAPRN